MVNPAWPEILDVFSKRSGIPGDVINKFAVRDILYGYVAGLSNTAIAGMLEISTNVVRQVLMENFSTPGRDATLAWSPIYLYEQGKLTTRHGFIYACCIKFKEIEGEINAYYGS